MKFFFLIIGLSSAFNIVFLPGSHIKKSTYVPFLNKIKNNLIKKNISTTISFKNYNPFETYKNDTILITHSFGGYFGLLNCINNPDNIKGCILINSHFNQNYKMPYFSIKLKDIQQPVLTILNDKDEILPLSKAINDFKVKYYEGLDNKYFLINNGTHLSSFNNDSKIVEQISQFIIDINKNNFSRTRQHEKKTKKQFNWYLNKLYFDNTVDCTQSISVLDALLMISNTPLWKEFHWLYFLISKPINTNYMYYNDDYVLYKSNTEKIEKILNEKIKNDFNRQIKWNKIYLGKKWYESSNLITKIISFVTVPNRLISWFCFTPRVYIKDNNVTADILIVPIYKNIVYYKFPNKLPIFEKLN